MLIHDLKYRFLLIAKSFDPTISEEEHGQYDFEKFYVNRIANNKKIAENKKELLKLIFSYINVFTKDTKLTEYYLVLKYFLKIALSLEAMSFRNHLVKIIDGVINYYLEIRKISLPSIIIDNNAKEFKLTLLADAEDKDAVELSHLLIRYYALHPKLSEICLYQVDDRAIENLYLTIPSLVFEDCNFTEAKLELLLSTIKGNAITKYITVSGGNLIRNISNQRLCVDFVLDYFELESFEIMDEGFIFVSNIFNEFIYQRKKLFLGQPADTKHAKFFTLKLYEWIEGNYNIGEFDHKKYTANLNELRLFEPDGSWARDAKIQLIQYYKTLLGVKVQVDYQSCYLDLMSGYNKLKIFTLYDFELRIIINQSYSIVEQITTSFQKPTDDNILNSFCFAQLLVVGQKVIQCGFLPKKMEENYFNLLQKYIDLYSKEKLPVLDFHYDIVAGIYAITVAYLKLDQTQVKQNLSITSKQCNTDFITKLLVIVQKIYLNSVDINLRLWISVNFITEFEINHSCKRFRKGLSQNILLKWDEIVDKMKLQKFTLSSFPHLSIWRETAYLIMAHLLMLKDNMSKTASIIIHRSNPKLASGNYVISLEFVRGLKLSEKHLKSWCKTYEPAVDKELQQLINYLLSCDFYEEMVLKKQVDRFDYWDVISPLFLVIGIYDCMMNIYDSYVNISDNFIETLRKTKKPQSDIILEELKIYEARKVMLINIFTLQSRNFETTKKILANEEEFKSRYGAGLATYNMPQKIDTSALKKQETLIKLCNVKLLSHQQYSDAVLKEYGNVRSLKQSNKKNVLNPKVYEIVTVEDTVETHLHEGNIPSAFELAVNKLASLPNHLHYERALVLINLADCYHAEDKDDESQQAIKEARKHIELGVKECIENNESVGHFKSLEFALFEDEAQTEIVSFKAIQKLASKGNMLEAIPLLENLISQHAKRKPLMLLAELYEKTLHYSKAEKCYMKVIESSYENDIVARSLLIHVLCRLNRMDEAQKHLVCCENSTSKYATDARIRFYIHTQEFEEALYLLEKHYIPKKGFNFQYAAAYFLHKMCYFDMAKRIIDKLLNRNLEGSKQELILCLAYDVYHELSCKNEMEKCFDNLVKLNPYKAYQKRSGLALLDQNYVEALLYNTKAMNMSGNSIHTIIQKFDCEFGLNDFNAAHKTLMMALTVYPKHEILYKLKHKLKKARQPIKLQEIPLPAPEQIVIEQQPPLLFEKLTKQRLAEIIENYTPIPILRNIVKLAQECNIKIHFYGDCVYQLLLGKSPASLQIAVHGVDQLQINFIKIKFFATLDVTQNKWLGNFGDISLEIKLCVNLNDHHEIVANLLFSSEEFIINDQFKLIDCKNNAEKLLIEHQVTVNPACLKTGIDLLSSIRSAHDQFLRIENYEMYLACAEMLKTIRPHEWILELGAVMRSADPVNTLDLWLQMKAFKLLIPRLQLYYENEIITVHHIAERLLFPKNPKLIKHSYYPGIAYLAECLLLLYELEQHSNESLLSEKVFDLSFYEQLPDWQRYLLENYLENVTPAQIDNPDLVEIPLAENKVTMGM